MAKQKILQRKQSKKPAVPTNQTKNKQPKLTSTASSQQILRQVQQQPQSLPGNFRQLQRAFGNTATRRFVQRKLTVGPVNDRYEQEADTVAQHVVQQLSAPAISQSQSRKTAQRHHVSQDDLQMKPLPKISALQRQDGKKSTRDPMVEGGEVGGDVETAVLNAKSGGTPMNPAVRAPMESAFGADFGNVRIHTGSQSDQINRSLSARAFTTGQDIFFRNGEYNPSTPGGQTLLAHELTHVVQQSGGQANPVQTKSTIRRTNKLLQRHTAPPKKTSEEEQEDKALNDEEREEEAKIQTKPMIQRQVTGTIQRGPISWAKKKWKKWKNESYNVRMGGELPDTKKMGNQVIKEKLGGNQKLFDMAQKRKLEDAMTLLQNEDNLDKILQEIQEDAREKNKPVPSNDDKLDFRLAMGDLVAESDSYTNAHQAYLRQAISEDRAEQKKALLFAFTKKVNAYSALKLRESDDLPSERKFITESLYTADAAEKFWESREGVKLDQAYLTDEQKATFAEALKQMNTVKFLLGIKEEKQDKQDKKEEAQNSVGAWKDSGSLVDNIKEVDDFWKTRKVFNSIFDKKRAQKRLKSKSFRRRVQSVDTMMKTIVSPEILKQISKPEIHVHATAALGPSAPWGFRAWASGGKELHVAYNQETNVIAHEVGHIIEEFIPAEIWHDIHLLLGARHEASGGGKAKAGATFPFTTLSEGRYGGKYVTGNYTSTAYKDGVAEVVSMAMQFFSDPAHTQRLIDGDPLHAAIVLRGIKPEEYQATKALRPYDKYLPHK